MRPYTLKETVEQEVKLRPPSGFHLPSQLAKHPLPKRIFTSTYYDTQHYDLARLGITLRRRVHQSKGTWQLKLPKGKARIKLEIPHGSIKLPVEFADLLLAFFPNQDPIPVAKLRTEQQPHQVIEQERTLATITLDKVALLENRRVRNQLWELEVELLEGTNKNLRYIITQLKAAGAENGNWRPKVCQALDLEYPEQKQTVEASAPAEEHLKLMLRQQVDEILKHDPGTRFGRDSEDLHQMRVATRRLRAILRTMRPLLDNEWISALRNEVSWLATILGTVRDFDVLLQKLRRETHTLLDSEQMIFEALLERFGSQRSVARESMLEALRSGRYLTLLKRLESAAQRVNIVNPRVTLQELSRKEFDKLRKAVHNLSKGTKDEDLHRLRICAKRVRHAVELAEQCIGRPATQFIQQVRKFQDILGEYQDTVMIEQELLKFLHSSRQVKVAFTTGLIVERLRHRRAFLRSELIHPWKKLKKRADALWQ